MPVSGSYIQQRVLLEMGARSLTEPIENKPIVSFIDETYPTTSFAQHAFEVKVVLPTRTFIEKALLLHEEFSKPVDKIRVDRLTRHLYDLDKIMQSTYGKQAIEDEELFDMIVEHREKITPLRGMDYSNHKKGNLKILPLAEVMDKWAADYKIMQENMIVGDSLKWKKLLAEIQTIEDAFNKK